MAQRRTSNIQSEKFHGLLEMKFAPFWNARNTFQKKLSWDMVMFTTLLHHLFFSQHYKCFKSESESETFSHYCSSVLSSIHFPAFQWVTSNSVNFFGNEAERIKQDMTFIFTPVSVSIDSGFHVFSLDQYFFYSSLSWTRVCVIESEGACVFMLSYYVGGMFGDVGEVA